MFICKDCGVKWLVNHGKCDYCGGEVEELEVPSPEYDWPFDEEVI